MMKEQQNILPLKIKKYTVGLQTLKETNETVKVLREKIIEFQPILEKNAKDNAELLIKIEREKKTAGETREICSKETADAQIIRDEVKEIKDVCEKEVAEALPILASAQEAVKKLDKNAVNEMKSFP
jgi:dynein heavy chain, axonemal